MAEDQPQTFSEELAKNAKKGASHETVGLLAGAGAGALLASGQRAGGWQFFSKVVDLAFLGWAFGMISRLWSEQRNNQASALKMDSKMLNLEHENTWLKKEVAALGGELPEPTENHAEKIKSERAAAEDCGCRFKH